MWGIGLLVLLAIYIGIIKLFVRITDSRRYKMVIVFIAVAIPLAYPFQHKIYPSYHEFLELCEAGDRQTIHTIKSIDYFYLGDSSMCHKGFKYLNNFKGIECVYRPKENGKPGNTRGVYRYIKGENWSSSSCGERCGKMGYMTQKEACQLSCMQGVEIDHFKNPYDYEFTRGEIINNKLYAQKVAITANEEVLAEFKNYTYYPYGNTWAKILGASSGQAPTLSCATKVWIEINEVYKPNAF